MSTREDWISFWSAYPILGSFSLEKSRFLSRQTSVVISLNDQFKQKSFLMHASDIDEILEGQILYSIVVVVVGLHRAIADELVDGRIGSRWMGWLTSFCCNDSVEVAHFLAIIIIFGKDGILVDGSS